MIDIEKLREASAEKVAEALGEAYDCTRTWGAWSYGTMGPGDFCLVAEDSDRLAEIVEAALAPALQAIEAQAAEIARLHKAQRWRPINTAPLDGTDVLLRSRSGQVANGHVNELLRWVWPYINREPAHWMPLPAATDIFLQGES